MNITNNYVTILVHFSRSIYEGSHLSYIQYVVLSSLYEFTIYLSTGYSMRYLKLILPTIMLAYLFILVCSFICVYFKFLEEIPSELNMK